MDGSQTVNLNGTQCIAMESNWGSSTIHNICSGINHVVPWGTMDYLLGIGSICLIVLLLVFIVTMLKDILTDLS